MNPKIFKANKSWIAQGPIFLFCGIFLGGLIIGIVRLADTPLNFVILGSVVAGLLVSSASLAVWLLGPKSVYVGDIGIDDNGFTMRTFRKEEFIKWDEIQNLTEEKTTAQLGGITFGTVWYWGPDELYTIEGKTKEKAGFSSETEGHEKLLQIIVDKANLRLTDTSLVHGGRIWIKKGISYKKRPRLWFNWIAAVVIVFFVLLGIYMCWRALYPQF